jgi:hypothetical protein
MPFRTSRCLRLRPCSAVPRTRLIAKLDAAPYDDEEVSEEDLQAIRQARSEPGIPWPEAEAELSAG